MGKKRMSSASTSVFYPLPHLQIHTSAFYHRSSTDDPSCYIQGRQSRLPLFQQLLRVMAAVGTATVLIVACDRCMLPMWHQHIVATSVWHQCTAGWHKRTSVISLASIVAIGVLSPSHFCTWPSLHYALSTTWSTGQESNLLKFDHTYSD